MTNTVDSSTSISQRTRSSRITPLAPHPSIKYESPELEDISIPLGLPTKNENPDIEDTITAGKRRENLSRISRQPTSVIKKEEESNSALKNNNCRPERVRVPPHGGLILSPKNESPDIEGCNAARKRGKGATQNSRKPALIPKRLRESRSKLKDKSHLVNLPSAERIIQSFRYKSSDIEDIPFPGKIKRDATEVCQPSSRVRMTRDSSSNADSEDVKPRKLPQARRQIKNKGPVSVPAPSNWAEIYGIVKEMRTSGSAQNAPVDRMGCERLALPDASPRDRRYQTLTALMLSSQTKDSVNAAAMNRLYFELKPHTEGAPKGLTVENIIAVEPKDLNELINQVGFHNNKTKYMKATAEILRDKWNSDIPDTIEGLKSLPGVGPKMAYLCLSSAWGRTEGIGVDVHVHRITNRWRWQETSTPEETRLALESWLPKEHWHELNSLLVGLGQLICLPIGRKCDQCELSSRGLCPAAK